MKAFLEVTPNRLLFAQAVAHLSFIPFFYFINLKYAALTLFVYFLTGCLGMTMTYHRLLSHKSWTPPYKWVEYLFTLFATVGMTGPAISWVAAHREHHAFMDTEKDPHGPAHRGYAWCQWLSMYAKVHIKYAIHLVRDEFYINQQKYYFHINLVYGLVLYSIDPLLVVYAWLAPAAILWNMGSSIVSISHRYGRAHDDLSLALLVWGEGYHKVHHDFPMKNRFGKFDLGGIIIGLLNKNVPKIQQ